MYVSIFHSLKICFYNDTCPFKKPFTYFYLTCMSVCLHVCICSTYVPGNGARRGHLIDHASAWDPNTMGRTEAGGLLGLAGH